MRVQTADARAAEATHAAVPTTPSQQTSPHHRMSRIDRPLAQQTGRETEYSSQILLQTHAKLVYSWVPHYKHIEGALNDLRTYSMEHSP